MSNRSVGDNAETLACTYLSQNGYKVIERNFQIRGGEIDIVAREGEILIFVEVKARYSHKYGLPEESITYFKIKALKKTALFYITKIKWGNNPYRFDLLTIDYTNRGRSPEINLIKNII